MNEQQAIIAFGVPWFVGNTAFAYFLLWARPDDILLACGMLLSSFTMLYWIGALTLGKWHHWVFVVLVLWYKLDPYMGTSVAKVGQLFMNAKQ